MKATVAAEWIFAERNAAALTDQFGAAAVGRRWCAGSWLRACAGGWLLVVSAVVSAAQPDRQEPFPATVRVLAEHTYLRAGPGDDFYPTERLTAGTDVEVWAVDPTGSGYVAVRPVAGSFSWLRASDVDTAAEAAGPAREPGVGVGVVITDGAVSRVGSQLNDLRHVAQVTLEAGERVRVLEEVRIASGRHAGLWARIEPPAGEFRWARLADLETPAGMAVTPASGGDAEAAAARATLGEAVAALKDAGVALAQAVGDGGVAAVSQAAPTAMAAPAAQAPAAAPPPQELGFMPAAKRLFSGWLPRGTSIFDPAAPIAPVAVTTAGPATGSGDELADIDLALSLAVTGPAESWNLAPVRERLRQVAARTGNDAERTRIAAIDARIARFEAIQGRHRTLQAAAGDGSGTAPPLQIGGMWSSLSSIGSRPIRPGVLPGGAPADGQPTWTPPDMTETTGRLATVVSRRPDAPRWAVVDQSNNVIAFVTPQTGVNLAPLVGQDVTVRGARGYMPEYKRPYVVAAEARTRMAAAPDATPDRAVR